MNIVIYGPWKKFIGKDLNRLLSKTGTSSRVVGAPIIEGVYDISPKCNNLKGPRKIILIFERLPVVKKIESMSDLYMAGVVFARLAEIDESGIINLERYFWDYEANLEDDEDELTARNWNRRSRTYGITSADLQRIAKHLAPRYRCLPEQLKVIKKFQSLKAH